MIIFLCKHNISNSFQFGFRPSSNTSLAIFNLVKDFMNTFNRKAYTVALFIDLKKAFDLVDRDILASKLSRYGFRGVVNDFLTSYLSNRKQFTTINDFRSDPLHINHGVPQGSVLGPVLFNIFINDMINIPSCKKILFADDTVFYTTSLDFNECIYEINEMLRQLKVWLQSNRLLINVKKTKLMLITPKFQPILPPVYFDGAAIEWVQTIKYLGLTLDNRLTFNIHVNEICNKLSKFKGVFYSLSSLVPRSVLLNLYSAFVYPVLINNIIIWGGLNLTNGRRIQILLNKMLRIILNVEYNNYIPLMDTTDMYKQLELLKFYDIYR